MSHFRRISLILTRGSGEAQGGGRKELGGSTRVVKGAKHLAGIAFHIGLRTGTRTNADAQQADARTDTTADAGREN